MQENSKTKLKFQNFSYEELDSTNTEAFRLYKKLGNDALPFVVNAQRQSSGRGQFDREWKSPEGNLYMTFAISKSHYEWMHKKRIDETGITLKVGDLVYQTVLDLIDDKKKLSIKKPNDILFDSKKLAGILTEVKNDLIVIGIGLNLAKAPKVEQGTISLNEITKKPVSLKELQNSLESSFIEIF